MTPAQLVAFLHERLGAEALAVMLGVDQAELARWAGPQEWTLPADVEELFAGIVAVIRSRTGRIR